MKRTTLALAAALMSAPALAAETTPATPPAAATPAPTPAAAATPAITATACFTPGEDCASKIVTEIAAAKTSILLQAPSITLPVFSIALAAARARGVSVKVILDKSSESLANHSGATYLASHGVVPMIDDKVESARNTAIVIDGNTVITGSFTLAAAPTKGATESLLIVKHDEALAHSFADNFNKRAATARLYGGRFRGL